jgi:Bacterial dnaA protein helix-turn-helix
MVSSGNLLHDLEYLDDRKIEPLLLVRPSLCLLLWMMVAIVSASWSSSRRAVMNNPQLREPKIWQIQDAVAHMFGLAVDELRKESGPQEVAMPRHIAMYLSKQLTDASVSEIGLHFGGRQQTSVRYSIAKVQELRATDDGVNKAIETLLEKLTSLSGQG